MYFVFLCIYRELGWRKTGFLWDINFNFIFLWHLMMPVVLHDLHIVPLSSSSVKHRDFKGMSSASSCKVCYSFYNKNPDKRPTNKAMGMATSCFLTRVMSFLKDITSLIITEISSSIKYITALFFAIIEVEAEK